ncbi:IS66 family transposase, partial [Myxococcota bacterium]|nr:IS66 family transposase [Myxococcota bacterium]
MFFSGMVFTMVSQAKSSSKMAKLEAKNRQLSARVEELAAQVQWFQKQLFGQKSERRIIEPPKAQLYLGEQFKKATVEEENRTVKEHKRKKRRSRSRDSDDGNLFFDEEDVPVEEIEIVNPEVEGLSKEEYEVISQKISYRLAQRPGAYVILKYIRDVIKKKGAPKDEKQIFCPTLPPEVFEKSHADVSFLAGMLVDKFL